MTTRGGSVLGAVLAALLGLTIIAWAGCAHVQNVANQCEGAVTPALVMDVTNALKTSSYETAVATATVGIAPCLVVASIEEIITAIEGAKAALTPETEVVLTNAKAWRATHGGSK